MNILAWAGLYAKWERNLVITMVSARNTTTRFLVQGPIYR